MTSDCHEEERLKHPADVFALSVPSVYCRWHLITIGHSFENRFVNVDKLTPG
jgi:hypothetical protein